MMLGNMKMISMLIQMGADLTSLNNYDLTPADFASKALVKELSLQHLQTNINSAIKQLILKGELKDNDFVQFNQISQRQKEYLSKTKSMWMDIFHNLA